MKNIKIIYDLINAKEDGFSIGSMTHNPRLVSATLADALTFNDEWKLYVEEEGRIYHSVAALEAHMNYVKQLNKANERK